MDTMPLKVLVLGAIPECILVIYLGLILIGRKPEPKRVIIAGFLQAIACYFIRKYVGFGPHIILIYLAAVLFTWLIVKAHFIAALISNLIAIVIVILVEGPLSLIIPSAIGISMGEIMSRSWIRLGYYLPYLMILLVITYLCNRFQFNLEQEIYLLQKINKKSERKI